jgi:hypothetical protein
MQSLFKSRLETINCADLLLLPDLCPMVLAELETKLVAERDKLATRHARQKENLSAKQKAELDALPKKLMRQVTAKRLMKKLAELRVPKSARAKRRSAKPKTPAVSPE